MSNDEHANGNGSSGSGGGSGGGDDGGGDIFDPSEDTTSVEHAVSRSPSELDRARADAAAFDIAASAIDAVASALDALPEACTRLSRPRRSRFVWALILKIGELVDEAQLTRHDLTELKRHFDEEDKEGTTP